MLATPAAQSSETLVAVLARLMNDDRTLLLRNGRKDGGHVVVEDLGAEAAAEDEDAQRPRAVRHAVLRG